MGLVDEIKKELKEFYEKQVKVFFDKAKTNIKETFNQILVDAAKRRKKIFKAIKIYFDKLTDLYFQHLHPTLRKYWRKLVYLWIVCKHYGKRFCLKVWHRWLGPALRYLYKGVRWIVVQVLIPLLKHIYRAIEYPFNLARDLIIWVCEQLIKGFVNLGNFLRWGWNKLVIAYRAVINVLENIWGKLIVPALDFLQRITIEVLTQVFKLVRYLWINILQPVVKFIGRALDVVFNFITESVWWVAKQIIKGLKLIYPYVVKFATYVWDKIYWVGTKVVKYLGLFWDHVVVRICRMLTDGVVWVWEQIIYPVGRLIGRMMDRFFKGLEYIFNQIMQTLQNLGQWLSKVFTNLWNLIKSATLFVRDCLYVTLGLPIYLYKRVTTKSKE